MEPPAKKVIIQEYKYFEEESSEDYENYISFTHVSLYESLLSFGINIFVIPSAGNYHMYYHNMTMGVHNEDSGDEYYEENVCEEVIII